MAFKVSKTQIRNQFGITIEFGYCEIQRLLRPLSPTAYCAGVYGWTCDFYQNALDSGINIVTGYNTSQCRAFKLPKELRIKFKDLEDKAHSMDLDELRIKFKELLDETHKYFVN